MSVRLDYMPWERTAMLVVILVDMVDSSSSFLSAVTTRSHNTYSRSAGKVRIESPGVNLSWILLRPNFESGEDDR